jgi:hypothetical protein
MIELDVVVPAETDQTHIEAALNTACAGAGLRRTLKGTLARYPGSVHWHFAQPRERGTLEITWWPRRRRLWFKVSAGRTAPWLTALLPSLQQALGDALCAPPGPTPHL